MNGELLKTPLHAAHLREGARMVPYAGYEMPVQYSSILTEAKAVREGAGMFDVSHMARLRLTGPATLDLLEAILTNDVSRLTDGAGLYSLLPNKTGGCVDDVIVYRISETEYRMVVNAANHGQDVAWIQAENGGRTVLEDWTDATAMIAVQGPAAVETLAKLANNPDGLRQTQSMHTLDVKISGITCFAARSGYTGEDGFELVCRADEADALWTALRSAGVIPCGLASRDILRVEAGLPLYGHELGADMNPLSAGVGWAISKTKSFNGSELILPGRTEGLPRKLLGISLEGRRVADPGAPVYSAGIEIGSVSSGVFSPMLQRGIALAFVDAERAPGEPVEVEIRGKREPGALVSRRFFRRP